MKASVRQKSILSRGRISRFIAVVAVLTFVVALSVVGSGCGDSTSPDSTASTGTLQTGGILKIGAQPGNANFDPALFAGAVPDILLQAPDLREARDAGRRTSRCSRPWPPSGAPPTARCGSSRCGTASRSVTARPSPPTTSSTRWTACAARSWARRWPTCTPTSSSVEAADPTTVTFTLEVGRRRVPGFAHRLPHAHARARTSPTRPRRCVGTGPFVLESISAEDRAILKKNPELLGHGRRRQQAPVPG